MSPSILGHIDSNRTPMRGRGEPLASPQVTNGERPWSAVGTLLDGSSLDAAVRIVPIFGRSEAPDHRPRVFVRRQDPRKSCRPGVRFGPTFRLRGDARPRARSQAIAPHPRTPGPPARAPARFGRVSTSICTGVSCRTPMVSSSDAINDESTAGSPRSDPSNPALNTPRYRGARRANSPESPDEIPHARIAAARALRAADDLLPGQGGIVELQLQEPIAPSIQPSRRMMQHPLVGEPRQVSMQFHATVSDRCVLLWATI